MTITDRAALAMTPESQRIAIAEACGWAKEPNKCREATWGASAYFPNWSYVHQLPDYLSDLNAMHEAEKVLGGKWTPYARKLLEITTGCEDNMPLGFLNGGTLCSAVSATAAQRAEAFLRTLNLWTS